MDDEGRNPIDFGSQDQILPSCEGMPRFVFSSYDYSLPENPVVRRLWPVKYWQHHWRCLKFYWHWRKCRKSWLTDHWVDRPLVWKVFLGDCDYILAFCLVLCSVIRTTALPALMLYFQNYSKLSVYDLSISLSCSLLSGKKFNSMS